MVLSPALAVSFSSQISDAAYGGHVEVVKLLIGPPHLADVFARNKRMELASSVTGAVLAGSSAYNICSRRVWDDLTCTIRSCIQICNEPRV